MLVFVVFSILKNKHTTESRTQKVREFLKLAICICIYIYIIVDIVKKTKNKKLEIMTLWVYKKAKALVIPKHSASYTVFDKAK